MGQVDSSWFQISVITISVLILSDVVFIGSSGYRLSVFMLLLSGVCYLVSMGLGLYQEYLHNLLGLGLLNLMIINFYAFMGISYYLILSDVFPRKFYSITLSAVLVLWLVYSFVSPPLLIRSISSLIISILILSPHFQLILRERQKIGIPLLMYLLLPFAILLAGFIRFYINVASMPDFLPHYWNTESANISQLILFVVYVLMHTGSYLLISRLRTKESEHALEAAERQKSLGMTIVSLIGHDLQSPLSAIKSAASTLDGYQAKGSDSAPALIAKSADKTINLLDNLVYWGRGVQGELNLTPTIVDVESVIQRAWTAQDLLAEQKGIKLTMSIAPGTIVSADIQALNAVLRNIFSNAVKFSPVGSTIRAESTALENQMEIRVEDQGTGMSPEELELLRTDTVTESRTGKGIGMQMAHFICREAGWELIFESERGKGTTVSLRLPKA